MKIGIIGTGRIAHRMAATMGELCGAVYQPKKDSAEQFAREEYIPYATNEWEAFVRRVDAVYIASPHETHEEYIRKAISAGKHVLCEKPMAFSEESCRELFALAEANNLVLMEEMKTEDCPGFQRILADIRNGMIGEIVDVEAAFTKLTPSCLRERTDTAFGGSFTELGSYGMLPVFRLLGCNYDDVRFVSRYDWNGLDLYTKAFFTYGEGRHTKTATVKTGLGVKSEGQLLISGTSGYILVPSPWWLTRYYEIHYEDPNRVICRKAPYEGTGLQYRLGAFLRRINIRMMDELDVSTGISEEEAATRASVFEKFLQENKPIRERMQRDKKAALERISKPVIWAHRGLSLRFQENTLEAFKAAAELGPSLGGIETDVQLSKDGVVMIFHDETLDRVTDTKGNLRDFTFEELRRVKIRRHDGTYAQIPTLEEVLTLLKPYCEKNGLRLNIELKTSVYRYEGIEEKTLDIVRRFGMQKYVVYSSFLMDSIRLMKELDPEAETGMLASTLTDCIRGADQAHADSLHPWVYGMDVPVPARYQGEGHAVRAWGGMEPLYVENKTQVTETHMDEAVLNGVTDIITNVPEQYGSLS
ncbi:MAG: glycerophosphodiester phosphodiesterase family protein [Eubacteriales bacterium]|jgi:predicted dehydrogenase/glycerophosphoryl diester phosphodiesterase